VNVTNKSTTLATALTHLRLEMQRSCAPTAAVIDGWCDRITALESKVNEAESELQSARLLIEVSRATSTDGFNLAG
jgi:hypothetical protein